MVSSIPAPLSGKYAVVTGGSRGIGAAIALELAKKGAAGISITYTGNKEAAERVLDQLCNVGVTKCSAIKADLLSATFGDDIIATALKDLQTSHLDIVISNAALAHMDYNQPFESHSVEFFDKLMRANVWAPMQLMRAALPIIAEGGRFINVSSVASKRANVDPVMVYGASKAALDSMTRSVAAKYAREKKITVNSVAVGPTNTDAVREALQSHPHVLKGLKDRASAGYRIGEPEDIAYIVSFLASEEGRWINGNYVPANGGAMLELQG
jgi:3-oxoacyl-[acyl-carrier protein] reductase